MLYLKGLKKKKYSDPLSQEENSTTNHGHLDSLALYYAIKENRQISFMRSLVHSA